MLKQCSRAFNDEKLRASRNMFVCVKILLTQGECPSYTTDPDLVLQCIEPPIAREWPTCVCTALAELALLTPSISRSASLES